MNRTAVERVTNIFSLFGYFAFTLCIVVWWWMELEKLMLLKPITPPYMRPNRQGRDLVVCKHQRFCGRKLLLFFFSRSFPTDYRPPRPVFHQFTIVSCIADGSISPPSSLSLSLWSLSLSSAFTLLHRKAEPIVPRRSIESTRLIVGDLLAREIL